MQAPREAHAVAWRRAEEKDPRAGYEGPRYSAHLLEREAGERKRERQRGEREREERGRGPTCSSVRPAMARAWSMGAVSRANRSSHAASNSPRVT